MKGLFIWMFAAALTTASTEPIRVDPRPSVAPLTLQSAIDEALARNPSLIALRAEVDALRARPAQERFLAPPVLEAQIWQWPIDTLNPANTGMFMLMAGQELPGRGKRRLREAAAATEVAVAESGIAVRARAIIADVKRTYADLYVARKAIGIANGNLDLLRQLADVSQAKYATGRISQQDVLKAVVEISRMHVELIELGERARTAEARLNTLLDRPPEASVGPLADPPPERPLAAPSDLQRLAIEHQPELKTSRLEIARAEAQLAVVRSEYRPDFFVKGGYMLMPRDRDAWTASVGITWPNAPWSRGRLDAAAAEARGRVAVAKAQVDAAENGVRLMVQEAWIRARAAAERVALLGSTVLPQVEQSLDVARVAYQTDRVDFLALIDDSRVRLQTRLAYYEALAILEQARADLERAVGIDLEPLAPVEPPSSQAGGRN